MVATFLESGRPVIYVGEDSDSKEAIALLADAGFDADVRTAPIHYRTAYGTPVLFGLHNKFEGLVGVRIFIVNATLLGYPKKSTARRIVAQ